jgi:hypothetical protein
MTTDGDAPQGAFASLLDSAGDILQRFLGHALHVPTADEVRYPNRSFGDWNTPADERGDDRPTQVLVEVSLVATDGRSAHVQVALDDDGDGGIEKRISVGQAQIYGLTTNPNLNQIATVTFDLPPSGSYRIDNQDDPNDGNDVLDVREVQK